MRKTKREFKGYGLSSETIRTYLQGLPKLLDIQQPRLRRKEQPTI